MIINLKLQRLLIQVFMGVCQPQVKKNYQFTAYFSVNLRKLYDQYREIVQFIRSSDFFASSSQELLICIKDYLKTPLDFDKSNNGQKSIDSVHKLHPLNYNKQNVTQEWLLQACLRQNKFIKQFPLELLSFQECYKHYVQYIYLIFKSKQMIIVPNKLADFMWHSHMQDNNGYKNDTLKMLGRVLDHNDSYTQEQLKKYERQTEELRQKILRVPQKSSYNGSSGGYYHSYNFINYGHSTCGGSHHPLPPHPPHPDDHHPHPRPDDHHHHHHHHHHQEDSGSNNHHHNHHGGHDHHPSPSYDSPSPSNDNGGGGGASNCGGGGSSCGGGGSSCGGGGGGGGGD